MSKIGKKIIIIPEGVTVNIGKTEITIQKGSETMTVPVLSGVKPVREESELRFELLRNSKQARSNWGTQRALTANAVTGLMEGFEKILILEGVGYRVTKEGEGLTLNLGFSHPVSYTAVPGISFEVEKNTLKIRGRDKALVGKVAAEIRDMRPVEPYKGKGFRYHDEIVRRKAGKKAVSTA
jgi:large subunit ribosomal protein L6